MSFLVRCDGGEKPLWSIVQYFDTQEEAYEAKRRYENTTRPVQNSRRIGLEEIERRRREEPDDSKWRPMKVYL